MKEICSAPCDPEHEIRHGTIPLIGQPLELSQYESGKLFHYKIQFCGIYQYCPKGYKTYL